MHPSPSPHQHPTNPPPPLPFFNDCLYQPEEDTLEFYGTGGSLNKPPNPIQFKGISPKAMKVLVSRPDKIGDVILALHGAKQLKALLPEIHLTFHVSGYTKELLENISFIDEILVLGRDNVDGKRFDAVIDLMAKYHHAKEYKTSAIPLRIGNSARWFRFLYTRSVYVRRSKALLNEAEYDWQIMRELSSKLERSRLKTKLEREDFRHIPLRNDAEGRVVLMPGATVSAVGWPVEHWQTLANLLVESGEKVCIVLGPAEMHLRERFSKMNETRPEAESDPITVSVPEGLQALTGVLARAKSYIGPSTGVTHLASALGLEGFALYPEQRSMHPRRWLPFQSRLTPISLNRLQSPKDLFRVWTQSKEGKDPSSSPLNPLRRLPLSAFVICKNEERNLERCLKSIEWVDELVVVDSGSTDNTVSIAKRFTPKVMHHPWAGHRGQKQFALLQCHNDWVLNLDADEELSMELTAEIKKLLEVDCPPSPNVDGFLMRRTVHFLGRWWNKGGWHPEYRLRLLRRCHARWGGIDPHEKAVVVGSSPKLSGEIFHFTYDNFHHQIQSLNNHSSTSAQMLFSAGRRANVIKLLLHPPLRFLKFLILKQGIREGFPGILVAVLEAYGTFLKYLKLWELERDESRSSRENVAGGTFDVVPREKKKSASR